MVPAPDAEGGTARSGPAARQALDRMGSETGARSSEEFSDLCAAGQGADLLLGKQDGVQHADFAVRPSVRSHGGSAISGRQRDYLPMHSWIATSAASSRAPSLPRTVRSLIAACVAALIHPARRTFSS